jgi:RES domain-containing protein
MAEFASYRSYQNFSESVRTQWRYASEPEQVAFLKVLLATSVRRRELIARGTYLWRAQVGYDWYPTRAPAEEEQPAPFSAERMKPLRGRAREGRANPKGIPYLYLATHQDTAMAEVRPWVGSYVSVGQFVLKRDVHVIDCMTSDRRLILYSQEPSPEEREREVWQDIDRGFSQPVTSTDDTADYAPTQIVAEFFRANGLDGVAYGSSLGEGRNVALFDLDTASLVGCGLFEIRGVKFDSSVAANSYTVSPE